MARIKGNGETKTITPGVKLVNMSTYPLGTIVAMWIGSRYEVGVDPKIIEDLYYGREYDQKTADRLCQYYPEYAGENGDYLNVIQNVADMVIRSNLPPLDAINFTFEIDNANVAWREQLVRGRQPQNFWMQTSRTADLSTMDVNRLESIKSYGGDDAVKIYDDTVQAIRDAYVALSELGVPSEDIRLIPQGMTHRVYWMVPYRTLVGIVRKRMSWIAQASLWTPVIEGIVAELQEHAPFFAEVMGTPADVKIANGKVVSHSYDNENEDRFYGKDYQPCDPLWLAYRGCYAPEHTDTRMYYEMKKYYITLWSQQVCNIIGWDKEHPEVCGPYDPQV